MGDSKVDPGFSFTSLRRLPPPSTEMDSLENNDLRVQQLETNSADEKISIPQTVFLLP
jgi:hypothetical protein